MSCILRALLWWNSLPGPAKSRSMSHERRSIRVRLLILHVCAPHVGPQHVQMS